MQVQPGQGAEVRSEPNVIPFLDILLVLLVIFMASMVDAQAKQREEEREREGIHNAQLAAECRGGCGDGGDGIVLEVGAGGVYRVNGTPVAAAELAGYLARVYARRPQKVIQVAGLPGATYDDVSQGIDVAKGAGVRVVGLMPGR